ncbi:sensor histidine kinase [Planctomycetota bacterium]
MTRHWILVGQWPINSLLMGEIGKYAPNPNNSHCGPAYWNPPSPSYGEQDHLLPRIAPLVVPCPKTTASWVRIEATTLAPRAWDGKYILQLSEVLVFNGQENVALNQPIQASSPDGLEGFSRRLHFLVDGFLPYLMDASQGEQSIAFVCNINMGDQATLKIDLETPHPLNRIHLHVIDLDDTVPMSMPVGFGIPKRLMVEGATQSDFSDAISLVDYHMETIFDTGPIIIRRFPETPCRYVRLVAIESYLQKTGTIERSSMGFAEIELFSEGRNVAIGKSTQIHAAENWSDRSLSALTDGRNLYGQILPIRDWLNELARRHDLEAEYPIIIAELNRRYAHQKENLTRMKWLATLLAAGVVFTLLIDRILRMRQVAGIKERFAADLHDELGANLHTIGLLSDLAEQVLDEPEELSMLHQRIRAVTERTGTAMRYCASMQEANGLYAGLKMDMQRASMRIMAKLEHEISIEGEAYLEQLKPRTRVDLFLFYKECLVNISHHSGATKFTTRLTADHKKIHLAVSDNGRGIENSKGNGIPSSLKRRAHLLGAKVTVESPTKDGTCITLTLKTQRWGYHK